ncbi:MAG: helix-turn-helix domain-containing protein [Pirellulales bacterium]
MAKTKRTKAKTPATISDVLRRTILDRLDDGLTKLELSRKSGVPRPSIIRFLRGERTLRLDMADKLGVALGLRLERTNESEYRKGVS